MKIFVKIVIPFKNLQSVKVTNFIAWLKFEIKILTLIICIRLQIDYHIHFPTNNNVLHSPWHQHLMLPEFHRGQWVQPNVAQNDDLVERTLFRYPANTKTKIDNKDYWFSTHNLNKHENYIYNKEFWCNGANTSPLRFIIKYKTFDVKWLGIA